MKTPAEITQTWQEVRGSGVLAKMAKKTGINATNLSSILNGKKTASATLMKKIAKALAEQKRIAAQVVDDLN